LWIERWLQNSREENPAQPLIYVVDDSALERRVLRDELQNRGYRVREFVDGRDVLAWLRCLDGNWPDMILLDAMMKVMDGFATCEAIRTLPPGHDLPILMITARNDDMAINQAFDSGATDFIVKPVNIQLLCRRIDILIRARQADQLLRLMAFHDPLTGLPNRNSFERELAGRLEWAQRTQRSWAIVFLDLDRFKLVNDNLGHAAGDQLLQEVSRRFRQAIRSGDFVARLGGDEFIFILPDVHDVQTLLPVISSVFEACDYPVEINGQQVRVGLSMGVSFFPQDGMAIKMLMKKADEALYRAKEKMGNAFVCFSELN
jgi:diguanylate cyclase (GGDEF)-like protein